MTDPAMTTPKPSEAAMTPALALKALIEAGEVILSRFNNLGNEQYRALDMALGDARFQLSALAPQQHAEGAEPKQPDYLAPPDSHEAVREYLSIVAEHDATLAQPTDAMVAGVWALVKQAREVGVMPLAVNCWERGESYRRLNEQTPEGNRKRARAATQAIVDCIGSVGPENVEEAAARIVAEVERLRARPPSSAGAEAVREACARACDQGEFNPVGTAQYRLGYFDGCLSCAHAIRSLPLPPGGGEALTKEQRAFYEACWRYFRADDERRELEKPDAMFVGDEEQQIVQRQTRALGDARRAYAALPPPEPRAKGV